MTAGQPVIQLEDPVAAAQVEVKRAELAVLQHRFTAVNLIDLVQARLVREQLDRAVANAARAEQRIGALVLRAPRAGRFVVPDARKLLGKFIHEGDLLGYVIGPNDVGIHVVIPQAEIDPVRQQVHAVSVRLTDEIDSSFAAQIIRQTPAALDRPPAPALAPEGVARCCSTRPAPKQQRPLDQFFEIELRLDGKSIDRIGGRSSRASIMAPNRWLGVACAWCASCSCAWSMSSAGSGAGLTLPPLLLYPECQTAAETGWDRLAATAEAAIRARMTGWRARRLSPIVALVGREEAASPGATTPRWRAWRGPSGSPCAATRAGPRRWWRTPSRWCARRRRGCSVSGIMMCN
ncbi:MAG: HlyD family secretion protein [Pseudomonadota bacterium]